MMVRFIALSLLQTISISRYTQFERLEFEAFYFTITI